MARLMDYFNCIPSFVYLSILLPCLAGARGCRVDLVEGCTLYTIVLFSSVLKYFLLDDAAGAAGGVGKIQKNAI